MNEAEKKENEDEKTESVFTCDDCGKVLPVSKQCNEVNICNECLGNYENITGHCSAWCRVTGICDQSC